jgi:hypothetical protein
MATPFLALVPSSEIEKGIFGSFHQHNRPQQFKNEMQRVLIRQRILHKEYDSQEILAIDDL